MSEMKCPRCGVSLLGAVNCCWQCGLIVFADAPSRATEADRSLDPPSSSIEASDRVEESSRSPAVASSDEKATLEASDDVVVAEAFDPTPESPDVIEAEIVYDEQTPAKPARVGSPFAGGSAQIRVGPKQPSNTPTRPTAARETPGWLIAALETAPYGCVPLGLYALVGAILAKDAVAACFPATLSFAFGLLGLGHANRDQRLWSWGGLAIALAAALVGIWR